MRRRPAALVAAALLVTAALGGCSTDPGRDTARWNAAPSAGTTTTPTAGTPTAATPGGATGRAPTRTFPVGVRHLRFDRGGDRPLPVTVWYPGSAGRPAAGRFPVVLFSHGLTADPDSYAPMLRRWAAAGFVVVAPTYPHTSRGATGYTPLDVLNQPADASYVLTRVLELDGRTGDPLRGRLATDRVAAAGHSAGGITTVGLFTTGRDPRLDAGIVLAGSALGFGTAFAGPAAPQLFVHGELDDTVSYTAGRAAYEAVPWPKALLSLPDGDHGRSLLRSGNPAFDVVVSTTVDFLRWTLYRDPAARERLAGDAGTTGVARFESRL